MDDRYAEALEVVRKGWCLCRHDGLIDWALDEIKRLRDALDRPVSEQFKVALADAIIVRLQSSLAAEVAVARAAGIEEGRRQMQEEMRAFVEYRRSWHVMGSSEHGTLTALIEAMCDLPVKKEGA